jgi:hypothetical protein
LRDGFIYGNKREVSFVIQAIGSEAQQNPLLVDEAMKKIEWDGRKH